MAWTEADSMAMDDAAKVAMEELDFITESLSPEQLEGFQLFLDWVGKHKNTAGYKRLLKPLVGTKLGVKLAPLVSNKG
jgi:hypothetical protein